MYICKTEHVKTGKIHVFETVYDYKPGEIIYPWYLRSQYPGPNDNRHRVITCVDRNLLTRSQLEQLGISEEE